MRIKKACFISLVENRLIQSYIEKVQVKCIKEPDHWLYILIQFKLYMKKKTFDCTYGGKRGLEYLIELLQCLFLAIDDPARYTCIVNMKFFKINMFSYADFI